MIRDKPLATAVGGEREGGPVGRKLLLNLLVRPPMQCHGLHLPVELLAHVAVFTLTAVVIVLHDCGQCRVDGWPHALCLLQRASARHYTNTTTNSLQLLYLQLSFGCEKNKSSPLHLKHLHRIQLFDL